MHASIFRQIGWIILVGLIILPINGFTQQAGETSYYLEYNPRTKQAGQLLTEEAAQGISHFKVVTRNGVWIEPVMYIDIGLNHKAITTYFDNGYPAIRKTYQDGALYVEEWFDNPATPQRDSYHDTTLGYGIIKKVYEAGRLTEFYRHMDAGRIGIDELRLSRAEQQSYRTITPVEKIQHALLDRELGIFLPQSEHFYGYLSTGGNQRVLSAVREFNYERTPDIATVLKHAASTNSLITRNNTLYNPYYIDHIRYYFYENVGGMPSDRLGMIKDYYMLATNRGVIRILSKQWDYENKRLKTITYFKTRTPFPDGTAPIEKVEYYEQLSDTAIPELVRTQVYNLRGDEVVEDYSQLEMELSSFY